MILTEDIDAEILSLGEDELADLRRSAEAGERLRSQPLDLDDGLTGRSQPRRRTLAGPLLHDLLYDSGEHGFTLLTVGATERVARICRVCGAEVLQPSPRWICEFSAGAYVMERPRFPGGQCRCNWCVVNQDWRGPGRPSEVCSGCKTEDERTKRAGERERENERHRIHAIEIIRSQPAADDVAIGAMLGIRPKRVKEARQRLSAETHT